MHLETEPLVDPFALEIEFDITAAFKEATAGILTDELISLEDKVRRVETLLSNANSETYQAFVDFRALASQIEMFCSHDHILNESLSQNSAVSEFIGSHIDHDHGHNHISLHKKSEANRVETSAEKQKKKKKKSKQKKRQSWFGFYY